MSTQCPNPAWRTRVSLLVWNLTLDLSGLGDPASSYATAGTALEIIGARKPHRHDKAETPPLAYKEIINSTNVVEIRNMGKYLYKIR
jgi:hypothetical protein